MPTPSLLLATRPVVNEVRLGRQLVTLCEPAFPAAAPAAAAPGKLRRRPPGLAPPPGLEGYAGGALGAAGPAAEGACEARDPEVSSDCSTADTSAVPGTPAESERGGAAGWRARAQLAPAQVAPALAPFTSAIDLPLGSPQRPTAGSTYHYVGLCKPCVHAFKGTGCRNGALCAFCHLCSTSAPAKLSGRAQARRQRAPGAQSQSLSSSAALWAPSDLVVAS